MRVVVLACFFLSGASGLILEMLWTRMLTLVFGSTTLAVSTVLTAFMGGLGLGSYLAGKYADRLKNPVRAYALADAGTLDRLKAGGAVYVSKTSLDFYRAKLRPPTGWLTVQAATERYHYGRSALYKLLGRAKLRRRSIGGRVYLCGRDLDKSLGLTR